MFTTKQTYLAPGLEVIEIKFEGGILQNSPVAGEAGETNSYNSYSEDF